MNISVEYLDSLGATHNLTFQMTRLAFAKHMAIAGQGYALTPQKLLRTVGMFFHYGHYTQRQAFNSDRFSEPPVALSDPTEKGQFSNLAGKAIADFLSKRIDNSLYTVNYEAAMRIQGRKLTGQRPDLISYTQTAMFALEAKGRHQSNPGNMKNHKAQSKSGPIPINFSVACVSYNLFNQVTCKYHDPFNENVQYDNLSLQALTRAYYRGLSEFLNRDIFNYREIEIQGEGFYEVGLSYRNFGKSWPDVFSSRAFWDFEMFEHYRPRLILPKAIKRYAETGLTNEIKPFIFENREDNSIYIDNDRIGLRIR